VLRWCAERLEHRAATTWQRFCGVYVFCLVGVGIAAWLVAAMLF
jgi:hypothetical protein